MTQASEFKDSTFDYYEGNSKTFYDGTVNISDAQASLNYLFGVNPNLDCVKRVDFDDDGAAVVTDPVNMLSFLFSSGPPPPPPFPNPGVDPTPDSLPCGTP